jgi:hypothetical protein
MRTALRDSEQQTVRSVTTSTAGFGPLMGELDHAGTDVDIWPDGPPSEDVAKALTVTLRDAGWRVEYGA